MVNLLNKARNIFCAQHKVKLLSLAVLFFSSLSHAGTAYAPYVVEQAALWLPDYLETSRMILPPNESRRAELLLALKTLASEFSQTHFAHKNFARADSPFPRQQILRSERIEFRPGGDKKFDLPGRPPRMAVTGTALDSKVIFNLGLISDPRKFGFGDALGLWIHELGHKLPPGQFSTAEIDGVAAWLAKIHSRQMRIHRIGDMEILVLNHVPFLREGELFSGPWPGLPRRRSSLFAVLNGNEFIDLTQTLDDELDRFAHPLSNKLEVQRPILEIIKLKETPEALDMRIEMRTSRLPKNMNLYLADEMGPGYYKSARVLLSRDLQTLTVSRYVDEPAPRPLIMDGEAEFSAPLLSPDRLELQFTLRLQLHNRTHFHAAGYPEARFTVHALLDGEPLRLEAKVRYRLDEAIGGMPHEIQKPEVNKEGRVTVPIGGLRGRDLELIGMEDRFFTLGRGFASPENEWKRINVRETLAISLTACEEDLRP